MTEQERIWASWEFWRLVASAWTAQEQADLQDGAAAWMAA